jgi:hypothetical protein
MLAKQWICLYLCSPNGAARGVPSFFGKASVAGGVLGAIPRFITVEDGQQMI